MSQYKIYIAERILVDEDNFPRPNNETITVPAGGSLLKKGASFQPIYGDPEVIQININNGRLVIQLFYKKITGELLQYLRDNREEYFLVIWWKTVNEKIKYIGGNPVSWSMKLKYNGGFVGEELNPYFEFESEEDTYFSDRMPFKYEGEIIT
jgi:hypothetical protein